MLGMSLSPCCRYHPAGVINRLNQLSANHVAFAPRLRTRPPGILTFGATSAFTFVTARRLAHIPYRCFVNGLQIFGFPPTCHPSYRAPDSYPGRTDSCLTYQPYLDTQPDVSLSAHPAPASPTLETFRPQADAKAIQLLPVFWLAVSPCELTHPLRSSPITEPSTLLQDDPPPSCASILSPFVGLTYRVFS